MTLLRPLLEISRSDVIDYLTSLGQSYREDASNRDVRFTRNRIRHALLPHLREHYNPAVSDALRRLGSFAAEAHDFISSVAESLADRTVELPDVHEVKVNCGPLQNQPLLVIREMFVLIWQQQRWPLRDMGLAEWEALAQLATTSNSGSLMLPGAVRAVRSGDHLLLKR